jgi:hypothetical protein
VVFIWLGVAALIGLVGLAGGIDTGLAPAVTGGLGALLMPELAVEPVVAEMDLPPLSFRPLTPIQLFAAGAGVALTLLLLKDGFGAPPPSEEGDRDPGHEIDPLAVVLPPLPKPGPTFLRSRGTAESGISGRNPREPRSFGRRGT